MGYVLRAAAFAALLALGAIPAEAQSQSCFNGYLCIVDANGTKIGSLMQSVFSYVMREFKGSLYQFSVLADSIPDGVAPLYTNTSCTGTAYLDASIFPMPIAYLDSTARVWGPLPPYSTQTLAADKPLGGECTEFVGRGGPYTEELSVGVAKVLSAGALANLRPPLSAFALKAKSTQPCIPDSLCVVDATGTEIGSLGGIADNQVMAEFGSTFYEFQVDSNGIPQPYYGTVFYYPTSNCTGTPYIETTGTVVQDAEVDGNLTLWGAVPPYSMINMESELDNNVCYSFTGQLQAGAAQALTTALANLTPPFSLIATGNLAISKDPANTLACRVGTVCIVDANGNQAGIYSPYGFERAINGAYYQINTDGTTLESVGAYFYYTTSNCTGQAYMDAGTLLPQAEVDPSATVWGPGTPYSMQTTNSYYVATLGCVVDGPFSLMVGPATVLSKTIVSNLVAPFSATLIGRGNARVALNH